MEGVGGACKGRCCSDGGCVHLMLAVPLRISTHSPTMQTHTHTQEYVEMEGKLKVWKVVMSVGGMEGRMEKGKEGGEEGGRQGKNGGRYSVFMS